MKICVFCSANSNIEPVYFDKAREFGEWAAENGHTVVFGGCDMGLMGCVAKAAYENGGTTVGVVPSKIESSGRVSPCLTVEIPCENLSDRKDLMIDRSDVIVAFPGGLGTLDEIFTVVAAATIGYHRKKVVLYNINGFWDSLIALLDDLQGKGMVRGDWRDLVEVTEDLRSSLAKL